MKFTTLLLHGQCNLCIKYNTVSDHLKYRCARRKPSNLYHMLLYCVILFRRFTYERAVHSLSFVTDFVFEWSAAAATAAAVQFFSCIIKYVWVPSMYIFQRAYANRRRGTRTDGLPCEIIRL